MVDVGQRVYAASCIRQAEPGMTVKTDTDPVQSVRRTLLELLMADHPAPCARQQHSGDCELETLARCGDIEQSALPAAQHATRSRRLLPRHRRRS